MTVSEAERRVDEMRIRLEILRPSTKVNRNTAAWVAQRGYLYRLIVTRPGHPSYALCRMCLDDTNRSAVVVDDDDRGRLLGTVVFAEAASVWEMTLEVVDRFYLCPRCGQPVWLCSRCAQEVGEKLLALLVRLQEKT